VFGYSLGKTEFYILIMILAWGTFYVCHRVTTSRVGRALKAIRGDETAAKVCGIDIVKYKVFAFSMSAGFAAIAGSVYGHLNKTISPYYFDLDASITILVMIIVGGLGSNIGAIVGAVFIKLLPEFLAKYEEYHLFIYGALLLFVLIFAPKGIVGFLGVKASALKKYVSLGPSLGKEAYSQPSRSKFEAVVNSPDFSMGDIKRTGEGRK
jgi:branched-chain amino acid transport system permease protein